MAYTPVKAVIDGDSWTSHDMNVYVKDNFAAGVPDIFTTKGDIAVATGENVADRVEVGSNGTLLVADSAQPAGMKFGPHPVADVLTQKGDMVAGTAADTVGRVTKGTDGFELIADSAQTAGVKFGRNPVKDVVTTKGDLVVGTAADTIARLPVGPNYGHLKADSTESNGLKWISNYAAMAKNGKSNGTFLTGNADFSTTPINSGLPSVMQLDGAYYDTEYTVPVTGYYLIFGHVALDHYGSNSKIGDAMTMSIKIKLSGETEDVDVSMIGIEYCQAESLTTFDYHMNGADILYLAAGDRILIGIVNESYSTDQLDASSDRFGVVLIGAV